MGASKRKCSRSGAHGFCDGNSAPHWHEDVVKMEIKLATAMGPESMVDFSGALRIPSAYRGRYSIHKYLRCICNHPRKQVMIVVYLYTIEADIHILSLAMPSNLLPVSQGTMSRL